MSTTEVTTSTLAQAHEHADAANDFLSRGLLIPAAEEHYKAAEAFLKCVEQATNEHTKNTLRSLYNRQSNSGRDLQRRIAKLKEEGKDPNQPQVQQSARPLHTSQRGRTSDSLSNTFDESFMILNQRSEHAEESPFDVFWKVTSEIMDNLAQPMSFQSAAMAAFDAMENRSASSAPQAGVSSIGESSRPKDNALNKSQLATKPILNSTSSPPDIDDEEYDSLDDFCLIPSTSENATVISQLRKENSSLKNRMESMQTQMFNVKKHMTLRNEQDQQLRDQIMTARKEAQRVIAASTTLGTAPNSVLNVATLNSPSPGGRDREVQFLRRIRELEEELRTVKVENDKQKAMIAKFRDRWEKLKESAKRKKNAKSALPDSNSVRERIDEDPEGEEAAEEANGV